MTTQVCGYQHLGGCSEGLKFKIYGYFQSGRSAYFCETHGKEWNDLHPFGPVATRIQDRRQSKRSIK